MQSVCIGRNAPFASGEVTRKRRAMLEFIGCLKRILAKKIPHGGSGRHHHHWGGNLWLSGRLLCPDEMATRPKFFELHDLPGGLCTACTGRATSSMAAFTTSSAQGGGSPSTNVWEELGAVQDLEYVNHADFMQISRTSR